MGQLIRRLFLYCLFFSTIAACSSLGYHSIDGEVGGKASSTSIESERNAKLKQLYEKGEESYSSGDLEGAKLAFKEMLTVAPRDETALYRLGTIAFKQGAFAESAMLFEQVIEVNPRNGKAQYNLASIRLMQAENHFKYYAALAGRGANLDKITKLLGDIDEFASAHKVRSPNSSLDEIAGALKK